MSPASDQELMQDVVRGRTGALATLFERHHARLYRFCLRMTGNRQASEDLVQDVFVRMLRHRRSFRGEMALAPWMFRIARNACVDHLRRSSRAALSDDDLDRRPADDPGPDERLAGNERTELVRRALARLPVERREVLLLSRYELRSYDEIAGALGCSAGAVKVRAHRALKQLREVYVDLAREAST